MSDAQGAAGGSAVGDPSPGGVEISIDELVGLTGQGRDRLGELLQSFSDEVIQEASRMEEGRRARDEDAPEVTASIIDDSYKFVRPRAEPAPEPQKRPLVKLVRVANSLNGIFVGALVTSLNSTWQTAACAALAMAFLIGTFWIIWSHDG